MLVDVCLPIFTFDPFCQLCQWKAFFRCSSNKFLVEVDEAKECLELLNWLGQVSISNCLNLLGIC